MPLLRTCIAVPTPLPGGGFLFELEAAILVAIHLEEVSLYTWTDVQDQPPVSCTVAPFALHPCFQGPLERLWNALSASAQTWTKPCWVTGYGVAGSLAQAVGRLLSSDTTSVTTFGAPRWTTDVQGIRGTYTQWVLRCDPLPHTSSRDVYVHISPLSWLYGREPITAPQVHAPAEADRIWFHLLCTSDQLWGPLGDHSMTGYYRALRSVERAQQL